MKHKAFIWVVCLILTVFGFTAAMAEGTETVSTISIQLGELAEADDMVTQVLDSAAIRIHSLPDGYGAFVLSLNETDALQSLFKFEEDGIFVQSAALGQNPLYFTWEDIQAFMMQQIEANADMMDTNGMFNMDMFTGMMDGSLTEEQMLEMMGIDDEFMNFVMDIAASETVETGMFSLNGSDIATTKSVIMVTREDMIRAINLPIVRNQMSQQMLTAYPEYTEEEMNQEIDTQLMDIQQGIEESDMSMTINVYTADDEFTAFDIEMNGVSDEEPVGLSVIITKTTIEIAEFYQMQVTLAEGGEEFINQYGSLYVSDGFTTGKYTIYTEPDVPAFSAALNCESSTSGDTTGDLALTVYDGFAGSGETALIVFNQQSADAAVNTTINLFAGGALEDIKADLAALHLFTLNIQTVEQPDSGFFAPLQNASPETSVQLLQMSEDELDTYMEGVEQSLMMTVLTVIDNLPPELSESLMQGMGGF